LRELALHILDIAENSISAGASQIKIKVHEDLYGDTLRINVEDNGKGMDPETVARITDPFVTSRTTRNVGLGIPFFKAAAEACEGSFSIKSNPGLGTTVDVSFKHSHIDRMPLGNLTDTILSLVVGTPDVNWIFEYQFNDQTYTFDDQPIKEILDGIPLCEPSIIKYIRETIRDGIQNTRILETVTE
jgi:anti-sigma regulatory factor (Ser/Thr protein kinase)